MEQTADDLFLLDVFPRHAINVYLIGDVLLDAGTRHAARRILTQLTSRPVTAHTLTHAHPDHQVWTGPPHPVAKRSREGDIVGGFTVIDAPGHSPGQVAYWRDSDCVPILGNVLHGMNLITMVSGLHEPPRLFTVDPTRNR